MDSQQLLEVIVKAADAKQARDIVALDVATVSGVADTFVIMEALNVRQIGAIVDAIDDAAAQIGVHSGGKIEGQPQSGWVLMDFGDVIVNVFDADSRLRFNLEKLWSDAPQVDISEFVTE